VHAIDIESDAALQTNHKKGRESIAMTEILLAAGAVPTCRAYDVARSYDNRNALALLRKASSFTGPDASHNKDPKIRSVLDRLESRLGWDAFYLVDHWESDACAFGVASYRNPYVLVYISCHGEPPDRYGYELELPPQRSDDFPCKVAGAGAGLSFEELAGVAAGHLKRGEPDAVRTSRRGQFWANRRAPWEAWALSLRRRLAKPTPGMQLRHIDVAVACIRRALTKVEKDRRTRAVLSPAVSGYLKDLLVQHAHNGSDFSKFVTSLPYDAIHNELLRQLVPQNHRQRIFALRAEYDELGIKAENAIAEVNINKAWSFRDREGRFAVAIQEAIALEKLVVTPKLIDSVLKNLGYNRP
jgi:hypothetical protein